MSYSYRIIERKYGDGRICFTVETRSPGGDWCDTEPRPIHSIEDARKRVASHKVAIAEMTIVSTIIHDVP